METPGNSMLINNLYKQIADINLQLAEKQSVYVTALNADEPFEKIKELYSEMKSLRKALKELEAQVIISNYLAEC